jgi:hypothetical protein
MRMSANTCIGVLYAPRFPLPQAGLSAPSCRRRSSARRVSIGKSAMVMTSISTSASFRFLEIMLRIYVPRMDTSAIPGVIACSTGYVVCWRLRVEQALRHIVLEAEQVSKFVQEKNYTSSGRRRNTEHVYVTTTSACGSGGLMDPG